MSRTLRLLQERYETVRYDVFEFCRALNFYPTDQQAELLSAVQNRHQRIACKSGQGPGKTTVSTVIGMWWAIQGHGAKVIVTAPTMRQCRDVWIAECKRVLLRGDRWLQKLLKVTTTRVIVANQRDWGIQTVTATNPESAQGFHEKKLKVICEEASGIPRPLITQYQGTLSNPESAMLMIGNPNTRDCAFFDCFNTKRHLWTTMTFNAEETPESEWFSHQRNRDLEEEFGRNSDVYRVRVLGEFPHADPNCVISSEELERVSRKELMVPMARLSQSKQFGLDFARFGGDESVVYRRSGEAIVQWDFMARTDPNIAVDLAFRWQAEVDWRSEDCWYVADAGGIGQGVMKRFYDAEKQILEFHNGSSAVEGGKYANKITEAWFNFAKKVRRQRCYIPADNVLIQQLCTRQYKIDKKGRIALESKEDYVKRAGSSPDRADACVMAFYDETVAAAGSVTGGYGAGKIVGAKIL